MVSCAAAQPTVTLYSPPPLCVAARSFHTFAPRRQGSKSPPKLCPSPRSTELLASSMPPCRHRAVNLYRYRKTEKHDVFMVSCAAAHTPRRQGAKAKSPPMVCPCPKSKSFSCAPQLAPRETLWLRPRESIHQHPNTTWESCRFLRCSSGSSSSHHHGLSSTAPRLHLHQARHQPRVLLQVCLAW